MRLVLLFFFLFLFLATGCADELPSRSRVTDLRVLAIRAELPEIRTFGSTPLSVLAVQPPGDVDPENPVTAAWRACVDPAGDDPLRCLERDIDDLLHPSPGIETSLVLPEAAREAGGDTIGVLAYVCAGPVDDRTEPPLCAGEETIAVRRVDLSDDPENENPEIASLSLGGVDIPAENDGIALDACDAPCPRYRIEVVATDESDQTIPDAGRREALLVAFASDAGILDRGFDGDEPFEAYFTPPAGTTESRVWVVLHDDRGGVDFREILVDAQ